MPYPQPLQSIVEQFVEATNRRLIDNFYIRRIQKNHFNMIVLLHLDSRAQAQYDKLKPLLESKGCQVGALNENHIDARFQIQLKI